MRLRSPRSALPAAVLLLAACGLDEPKKSTVTQYYVEAGSGADDTRATGTKTGTATTTGTATGTAAATSTGNATTTGTATSAAATAKPVLALTVPNGQEVFVAGTPRPVTFQAQAPAGATLTYKLEYSPDGGTTWKPLKDGLTATTYAWDVTGLAQGTDYVVRVTADDGKGNTAQAASAKPFGVATAAVTFATTFGPFLKTNCGTCHDTGAANAGVFTDDNLALATIGVTDKAAAIATQVSTGKMPPAGALGAAGKDIVTLWQWSGSK